MISLNEYKKYLIDSYKYEIDNTEEKKNYRRKELDKKYGDEYLKKIIKDTYKVIKIIFENTKNGYCNIDMDGDTTCYISLNLTGGWFSDILYIDPHGNIISNYLLHQVFGKKIQVAINEKEEHTYEEFDDIDIASINYKYSLYIQGFPDNMFEIKEKLFGAKKLSMEKRDYISMIGKLNDGFGDNGWADGYADLPSDHNEILNQLYKKVPDIDLIEYLDLYLQGYELGNFMSENCEQIYDEDGCLKEDICLDTCPQEYYAKQLILEYKKQK